MNYDFHLKDAVSRYLGLKYVVNIAISQEDKLTYYICFSEK